MDDETARLMAEKGIWLSTQPFLDEEGEGGAQQLGPAAQAKMEQVIEGTDNVYRLAKKYHLKTAFGTDILFSAREAEQQGNRLAALIRWYTPAEALIMATSANAELLVFAIHTRASSA
jgi:imidazolonepropionase-like amidohydrolase